MDCLLIHFILVIEIFSFPNTELPIQNQTSVGTLSHLLIHKSSVVRVGENGTIFPLNVFKMLDYPGEKLLSPFSKHFSFCFAFPYSVDGKTYFKYYWISLNLRKVIYCVDYIDSRL